MLGVLIATVIAAAALVWIVVYVVREQATRHSRIDRELHDDRTPTLEYVVPTGHEPSVVMAALEQAGYAATVDSDGSHQIVMVKCPRGIESEREDVRSTIESATVTSGEFNVPLPRDAASVRFKDEV